MSRIDRLILSFTEQDSEEQRVATIDALVMYDMEEQYAYHLRHNASDSGVKLVGQEVLGRLAGGNPAHHEAVDADALDLLRARAARKSQSRSVSVAAGRRGYHQLRLCCRAGR